MQIESGSYGSKHLEGTSASAREDLLTMAADSITFMTVERNIQRISQGNPEGRC